MGVPQNMTEVAEHNARVAAGKKSSGAAGGNSAAVEKQPLTAYSTAAAPGLPLKITITGQIKGGKNNMVVTRAGLHFPKKDWAAWRNQTVAEIKAQLPTGWQPLSNPCSLTLEYVAGDLRRRDQPAIIDSIFHCLEKAGVVTDDTLLWVEKSSRRHDKEKPMAKLEFYHS
jgi:Holliday junction resolvase RusA-like endonuclease